MFNVNVDININVKWMEQVCPRAFCLQKALGGLGEGGGVHTFPNACLCNRELLPD